MEMAGIAALTLGGGLAANKVYKGIKNKVGNAVDYAKDVGKAAQTTKPGRVVSDIVDSVVQTPENLRKAGHALSEFENNYGDSFISRFIKNKKAEDLNNIIAANQIPLGYKIGNMPVNNEAIRDSLSRVYAQSQKARNLYNPSLKSLNPQEISHLQKQFEGLHEADVNALLLFGNDLKAINNLKPNQHVDNWDYPVSILADILNKS